MDLSTLREQLLLVTQVPLYTIVVGLELVLSHIHRQQVYTLKETIQNVYLSLVCFTVDVCFRSVYLFVFLYLFQLSFIQWGEKDLLYWILLIVLQDFIFYWLHRNDHFIRIFWATHVTHHSAVHYNISVGFRSSVLEPLYRFVYFVPLAFLGFEPLDILFVFSATQIWGTFIHTKAIGKLGILEYIFVTPSHHRVHHASNPKYLDKNMGMFLIIWDRLLGTFQEELPEEEYEPIRYGLTKNLENPNAVMIIFHEFIQICRDIRIPGLKLKERMNYLFGKPGYSHDGSRQTSEEMRRTESSQHFETPEAKLMPLELKPVKNSRRHNTPQ